MFNVAYRIIVAVFFISFATCLHRAMRLDYRWQRVLCRFSAMPQTAFFDNLIVCLFILIYTQVLSHFNFKAKRWSSWLNPGARRIDPRGCGPTILASHSDLQCEAKSEFSRIVKRELYGSARKVEKSASNLGKWRDFLRSCKNQTEAMSRLRPLPRPQTHFTQNRTL